MYEQRWNTKTPGCLIILLDQSDSMNDQVGSSGATSKRSKAQMASAIVNNLLREMVARCTTDDGVHSRIDVAVFGYGPGNSVRSVIGATRPNQTVSIDELAANPTRIDQVTREEVDPETGALIRVQEDVSIWIEPIGDNGTPMLQAFDQAYATAEDWTGTHEDSFPPIVVNITDGEWTDGDPRPSAGRIACTKTNDGAALIFNCHIARNAPYTIKYPSEIDQVLSSDGFARQLFEMSSELPDKMLAAANNMEMSLAPGARGFVFGGDMSDLSKFLTIASEVLR